MEFLHDLGFSDLDIEEIEKYNYPYILDNIVLNQEKIIDIVKYLFEIGLEKRTIKEIFMYQMSFMFKTKDEIQKSFDEYEMDSIIKSLNFDVNNIELIDFI